MAVASQNQNQTNSTALTVVQKILNNTKSGRALKLFWCRMHSGSDLDLYSDKL